MRLDELGQGFIIRLIMHLYHKDRQKTHYSSGRTMFGSSSEQAHYRR